MKNIADTREKKAKLNIVVSLGCQILTIVCGLIVPRMMIGGFGSEAYGATTSITQFLAYITLLEGGIGGVARAALYKPLAENRIDIISEIINEIKRFFRVISYIFIGYVFVLAFVFHRISGITCLDWVSTFFLVIVISISTFAQYFFGISYSVLLQASQRTYITSIINILATILNTIMVVVLVTLGCNLIIVKLVSSCVFVLRPILLWLYTRRYYLLSHTARSKKSYLTQKWAGLGQHIAFFLYSNTDVAVLTIFADLKAVAVYSVYYMVVAHIENLASSFSAGMEAYFGDLLARGEKEKLTSVFSYYETLLSIITTVLFSVTAVLIVPFVKIYTAGITDANYIAPVFSVLLILASVVSCLRKPYHNMVIAAGHFTQTQVAAYGEAVINIVVSVVLVVNFGLVGVAIGTFLAALFRMVYYAVYLSGNIFSRPFKFFVRRCVINGLASMVVYFVGVLICRCFAMSDYFMWGICGVVVTMIALAVTFFVNFIFYRDDFKRIILRKSKLA